MEVCPALKEKVAQVERWEPASARVVAGPGLHEEVDPVKPGLLVPAQSWVRAQGCQHTPPDRGGDPLAVHHVHEVKEEGVPRAAEVGNDQGVPRHSCPGLASLPGQAFGLSPGSTST